MNRHPSRLFACALLLVTLGAAGEGLAADLGRLFYTPAQRARLEAARAGSVARAGQAAAAPSQPLRFDGVIIRSDGTSTSWINGQPQSGAKGAGNLKPGQIRADGRVYEPYQVLRPSPNPPITEGVTP